MAQSAAQGALPAKDDGHNSISTEQIHELEQYEKIIRFRDAVLAGTHPTIKVPPELLAQARETFDKSASEPLPPQADDDDAVPTAHRVQYKPDDLQVVGRVSRTTDFGAKPSAPEINPILLEKSEHLVRAELRLQRQRAERALREEAEKWRPVKHAPLELSADIDIPDVLSKAQAIVPALPAAVHTALDATANSDIRSDSFDDNTFYSSQHDTPDLLSSPSHRDAAGEVSQSKTVAGGEDEAIEDIYNPQNLDRHHGAVSAPREPPAHTLGTQSSGPRSMFAVPGLNNYTAHGRTSPFDAAGPRIERTAPSELRTIQQGQSAFRDGPDWTDQPLATEEYAEAHPPSPLLRTHNLEPSAPQPVHPSTLPIDSSASNSGVPTATGTPAQVAALRHDPMSATSPDSSPQGVRATERKRSKKKKRKADRQATEFDHVFIKPEPRSPSPMAAPSYIRPSKRARHAPQQEQGPISAYPPTPGLASGYDAPDFDDGASYGRPSGIAPLSVQGEPAPNPQARSGYYPPRPVGSAPHGTRRYSGGYVDSRGRVAHSAGHSAHPSQPYSVLEPHEVMNDYMDSSDGYPRAASHQIPYEGPRMSLRPEGRSYVGAPRPQPQRIYVDSTGREYLEPPRRPMVRQSVAPAGYYRDSEIVYERALPRGASRYAEPAHYAEAGPAYAPAAQAYPTSRRVVTQPEYIQQTFGESYPGEYPPRSVMPSETRATDPTRQDFATRAASVRPPPPAEYAPPRDYGGVPDNRLETVARGYGQAAPIMGRQTPSQAYAWEYDAGLAAHMVGHTAPGPGYYPGPTRAAEDVAFIEQPRGMTQEIVYTDSGREEVYR